MMMLCLSRNVGQWVQIGDVLVQIKSMSRGCVQLGIQAPREVPIRRVEGDELQRNLAKLATAVTLSTLSR